jgi:dihydropyrimidinase
MSLLIRGGKIVNADRTFKADIFVEDGVIKEIAPTIEPNSKPNARVIDATGKIVIPGTHRHINYFYKTPVN